MLFLIERMFKLDLRPPLAEVSNFLFCQVNSELNRLYTADPFASRKRHTVSWFLLQMRLKNYSTKFAKRKPSNNQYNKTKRKKPKEGKGFRGSKVLSF